MKCAFWRRQADFFIQILANSLAAIRCGLYKKSAVAALKKPYLTFLPPYRMFELSILRKYLVPRKRHLSVTLIAALSVVVISAVVWLVLLFLSVTEGIEKTWLKKLTSLHAPLRITPTTDYLASHHYLIDTISQKAGYTARSLSEKLKNPGATLYDPLVDESPPKTWMTADDSFQDPLVFVSDLLSSMKKEWTDLEYDSFEMGAALLRLQIKRGETPSFLTQASYLTSFPEGSTYIHDLLLSPLQAEIPSGAAPIVLAKGFQDSEVKVGDRGWIQYQAATAGSLQEQRLPVCVSGFYDPGVLAVGSKCILAPTNIIHLINTTSPVEHFEKTASMGFCLWHADLTKTRQLAAALQKQLDQAGMSRYWTLTTYHDYEFSKDLMQQFQSDRYLFTLIGLIVLVVACSNIISFLILLVHDKKKEIGVLQALGASKRSIAFIFGGCGAAIGLLSSLIGIGAALLTLHHLDALVKFLSFLQGHSAFHTSLYGSALPSEVSVSALVFVAVITPLLSLAAGLIPAWKACKLSPSAILRSE